MVKIAMDSVKTYIVAIVLIAITGYVVIAYFKSRGTSFNKLLDFSIMTEQQSKRILEDGFKYKGGSMVKVDSNNDMVEIIYISSAGLEYFTNSRTLFKEITSAMLENVHFKDEERITTYALGVKEVKVGITQVKSNPFAPSTTRVKVAYTPFMRLEGGVILFTKLPN